MVSGLPLLSLAPYLPFCAAVPCVRCSRWCQLRLLEGSSAQGPGLPLNAEWGWWAERRDGQAQGPPAFPVFLSCVPRLRQARPMKQLSPPRTTEHFLSSLFAFLPSPSPPPPGLLRDLLSTRSQPVGLWEEEVQNRRGNWRFSGFLSTACHYCPCDLWPTSTRKGQSSIAVCDLPVWRSSAKEEGRSGGWEHQGTGRAAWSALAGAWPALVRGGGVAPASHCQGPRRPQQ